MKKNSSVVMKKRLAVFLMLFGLVGVFSPLIVPAVADAANCGTNATQDASGVWHDPVDPSSPCTQPATTGCSGLAGTANSGSFKNTNYFDLKSVVCRMLGILGALIPLIIGIATIIFIWGVVMYVIASDEEAKKAGRDRMIYGIIGFTVIITFWGLSAILATTLGINQTTSVNFPTIQYNP